MTIKVSTESVWAVIIELIRVGELVSCPFTKANCPSVGDLICFESKEPPMDGKSPDWVYAQATGIYNYYEKYATAPVDGLKLVSFVRVDTLKDLIIS